jgi:DNA-binding response OmpR family regulator
LGAIPLLNWFHKEAPGTTVIVLTARKVFEAAVDAFRAGASDVVVKAPTEIDYLKKRVLAACAHVHISANNERLLKDVFALHEDLLKRLMETSRRAAELEERLGGGAQSSDADDATTVLVVEPPDDNWLSDELERHLQGQSAFSLHRLGTGGEALDVGGSRRFHVALVRDALPDLPGTMVVSTIKAQSPETITILFGKPSGRPAKADVMEGSRIIPLVAELANPGQLIARLDELRQAFAAKSRERRYLAAFRQQNYELLKRFAELKQKLKYAVES